jgi:virginiamycin B lyase
MPFGAVTGIAVGSDGALWFTEETGEIVGHLTTSGASYVTSSGSFSGPLEIVSGADGAMWFTEAYGSEIGRLTIGGFLNFYYIPTINSNPQGITAGPDGALWFTEGTGNKIGRITYTGLIIEYPLPTANSGPNGITTGPDGALWFTEETSNKIGRITISGEVTEYALPTHNASPLRITSGPDAALWFTESGGNQIGRITTSNSITEYTVPTGGSQPYGITTGPDGALWFTEFSANKIGRITTSGTVTEYAQLFADNPRDIVVGPDQELWIGENDGVGQAVFVTANLSVSPSSGRYRTNLTFAGSSFAPNEKVQIYKSGVGSAVLASATADTNGSFSATGVAPESIYGARVFLGVGEVSGKSGAAVFSMVPVLTLNPKSGVLGSTVSVSGYGFGMEHVTVFWDSSQTVLGTAYANYGTFAGSGTYGALQFIVPPNASAGVHRILARGQSTHALAEATFTVE